MSRFTASVNAGSEASPSPDEVDFLEAPILALEIAKEGRTAKDRPWAA